MNRMEGISLGINSSIKAFMLGSMLVLLSGCASMEMKDASAKVKLTIPGILEAEAEANFRRKGVEEQIAFPGATLSSVTAQSSIKITTSNNASIPDQVTLATLSIKDASGNMVAARTFPAEVSSGIAVFSNPAEVEAWVGNQAVPDEGGISVKAPDIEIVPPSQGVYTATNDFVINGEVVASATASGFVRGGGGPQPPTDPK